MKNISKIVLTGGACAGKTTALSRISNELSSLGYYVLVVPETATELILSGIKPFGKYAIKVIDFQRCVIKKQIAKENIYLKIADKIPCDNIVILFDRGIMDGKAFLEDEEFSILLNEVNLTENEIFGRYDMVVHLVTAADGAAEFYTLENNAARTETSEEAIAKDRRNLAVWTGHPHLRIIDNRSDFDDKMDRLMSEVYSMLKEPSPIDIQKRFLVNYIDVSSIPKDVKYSVTEIRQDYLGCNTQDCTKMLRSSNIAGGYSYSIIEKHDVSASKSYRKERIISFDEYMNLMNQKDNSLSTIYKRRICFAYKSQYFSLDLFANNTQVALLQVSMTNESVGDVYVPEFLDVIRDVTKDMHYRNYAIARSGIV